MAESDYLALTVGKALAKCLTEVVLKQPRDPIEFIALWLYKYHENVLYDRQREIEKEEMKKKAEAEKQLQAAMAEMVLEEERLLEKEREARRVEETRPEEIPKASSFHSFHVTDLTDEEEEKSPSFTSSLIFAQDETEEEEGDKDEEPSGSADSISQAKFLAGQEW